MLEYMYYRTVLLFSDSAKSISFQFLLKTWHKIEMFLLIAGDMQDLVKVVKEKIACNWFVIASMGLG